MKVSGAIGIAVAALLAACGGGGGGGGGGAVVSTAPVAVAITPDSAKPVGADASGSVQNTSAVQGSTGLITGVQVQGGSGAAAPSPLLLGEIVRTFGTGRALPALPTGVAVGPVTEACSGGGTISLGGNVAGDSGLTAGDSITISATSCTESVGGQTMTVNGSMSFSVTSGFMSGSAYPYPFHVVLSITANNLSVTSGGLTQTSNGDMRLDWNATNASVQTLTASGSSLASGSTASGTLRTITWRNYTQAMTMNNNVRTSALTASVESTNPRLGTGGGSYSVTTPTTVQWDATTGLPTAGVIRAVGANNSALRVTFGPGTATLEVDADGNGTYESTVNSTPAELRSLL